MLYRDNANGVAVFMEEKAIIADSQPKLRRIAVLEKFDVSLAGFQIAGECVENAHGSDLLYTVNLSFRCGTPDNVFAHAY